MLQFKEWMVSTINADTTLQGYLKDTHGNMSVYPVDVDVQPEQFPAITYMDVSDVILAVPQGTHVGRIQLDIWSITSALEVEQIYNQLGVVFNFQHSQVATQTISGTLWWVRQESAKDFHTPARRIWRKSIDLKYWANNTTNT